MRLIYNTWDTTFYVHVLVEPCSHVPVVTRFEKEAHITKRDIVGLITQNFLNFNILCA